MKMLTFLNRFTTVFLKMLAWSIPAFCGEIHDAVKAGDLAKVKSMLKTNPDLISNRDQYDRMPLHWAAYKGHKDVVELLLINKAYVNGKDSIGDTRACRKRQRLPSSCFIESAPEL
jgi:hypothetical protein